MKKQTITCSVKMLSLAIVATITFFIGAAFPTSAQQQPTYKVGDRVEAKPVSTWKRATIVAIDMSANAAVVRMDDEKDDTGAQREYTTHVNNLRPLSETAGEKQTQVAKQTLADNNVGKLRVGAKQHCSG